MKKLFKNLLIGGIIGIFISTAAIVGAATLTLNKEDLGSQAPTITDEPTTIPTSAVPTVAFRIVQPTIDPYPITDCNTKSKGVIKMRKSACVASVDCLIGGKYYLAKNNDECNSWVKQQSTNNQKPYIPDHTYTPYSSNITIPTIKPYPTSTPYQGSQAISSQSVQGCLDKFRALGTLDSSEAQKCYSNPDSVPSNNTTCFQTWEEYFKAHPGYVGNMQGTGSTPPCH